MRNNGKKMFPGKNESNIFFLDKKSNINANPKKYINKNNRNNIISNLNNNNNTLKISIKCNLSINDGRKRHNSLERFNSTLLQSTRKQVIYRDNNNKKVLHTERSVDSLRKPKRILGSFSTRNYILNKNNIWDRHKSCENLRNSAEYNPLHTFSAIAQSETQYNNPGINNKKITSTKYYNKFINKPLLTEQIKNGKNKIATQEKNKKKDEIKIGLLKEQTFIIKKKNQNDQLIDLNELKKKFSQSGINIISIDGTSNSLIPINKDSVKIVLSSADISSNKFKNVERYIKKKGLEFNEIKKNHHIKYSKGIYPNKYKWSDVTYGGRENEEKKELSSRYNKNEKEKKFFKKNGISKNNFYKDVKYKNNIEVKPKRYKSVEKNQ